MGIENLVLPIKMRYICRGSNIIPPSILSTNQLKRISNNFENWVCIEKKVGPFLDGSLLAFTFSLYLAKDIMKRFIKKVIDKYS